jgi:hypothetical protein
MARGHVEFIQAQAVPWSVGLSGGARDDIESKILSFDPGDGAMTAVLRYPKGWARNKPERLAADEEFFVLSGAISINGIEYGPYSYAYLPAGFERREAVSENGTVSLTFFEAEPRAADSDDQFRADGGLVEFTDANDVPWKPVTLDDLVPTGLMTKNLRIDPDTQDRTWMNTMAPGWNREGNLSRLESHPVVEEMYQLSGDLSGDRGILRPGAYFWRPPEVLHGPYGTRTGYLAILRCKGGPLVNRWSEAEHPFTFDPEHKPDLPPELESYGRQEWTGEGNY